MRTYGRGERCVLKRESKKKPYRSAWSNGMWSYREMLRETPQTFWLMVGCVPLGVFLPLLMRKLRRFWRFLLVCALTIALVETAQALLLVGSADVDDLILNLCGVSIGFPFGLLAVKLLDKGDREN